MHTLSASSTVDRNVSCNRIERETSAVLWWREEDSNLRSRPTTDLQSVPFGHSGIPPDEDLNTTDISCKPRKEEGYSEFYVPIFRALLELAMGLEPATC